MTTALEFLRMTENPINRADWDLRHVTTTAPAWWEDDECYLTYQLNNLEPRRDAFIGGYRIRRILTASGCRNRSFFNVWKDEAQPQIFKSAKKLARMLCTCDLEQTG